jgi:hypothetical protein
VTFPEAGNERDDVPGTNAGTVLGESTLFFLYFRYFRWRDDTGVCFGFDVKQRGSDRSVLPAW